ncbi:hypothetical protein [Deinococcus yavapaiensis]|uniref:Uncharacterized protein n=1 Tax=Deinococcus yavapaiensis KR-236 TaxID=694435 RepID=A0A318S4R6_9DEIO|nr:hypothetical protein [Deinococcus yavapaiensis]PYE50463.1 hypothetical protein DES52_11880 [Deinococcus yavapaiensis KR-236]
MHEDACLGDPLLFLGGDGASSPIGMGFSVIQDQARKAAERCAGDAAFEVQDDENALTTPWSNAASALTVAAMAFGAPQLVHDHDSLERAWRVVFGSPPTPSRS